MNRLFYEGLALGNKDKLLLVEKSDLHNHSTKGCTRLWLEKELNKTFNLPNRYNGISEMNEWFCENMKPYCSGKEGCILRWKGAFIEARRNHIKRLSMSFTRKEIELVGGMIEFMEIIDKLKQENCPTMEFLPELTYPSSIDVDAELKKLEEYFSYGFFRYLDICGGENVQDAKSFIPMYQLAEKYHVKKRMHVGETGTAEDILNAVMVLNLDEIHHGINAYTSTRVMDVLKKRKIILNVCPTSNVKLGYVKEYASHPIRVLVDHGVLVTINTDDLLLLDSSIEEEYLKLYQNHVLSIEELEEIRLRGLGLL